MLYWDFILLFLPQCVTSGLRSVNLFLVLLWT